MKQLDCLIRRESPIERSRPSFSNTNASPELFVPTFYAAPDAYRLETYWSEQSPPVGESMASR